MTRNKALLAVTLILLAIPNSAGTALGNAEDLLMSIVRVADWLVNNQNPDGTFNLKMSYRNGYYQDALILGCAAIVLLDAYHITDDTRYLEAANLTLTLLAEWQELEGDWSSRSHYAAGGVYYPIMAFAKFQIYTNNDVFMENMLRAADSLIRLAEEKSIRHYYVFEMGERSYALLLVWKATNITRYKGVARRWIRFLEEEAFDHEAGAWNTRIDGKGPQGMWDAVLPALPLLASNYIVLRELANRSFFWALENLSSFEPGAYTPSSPAGEISLSDEVYRDEVNAYPHFVAEFLILASILGREAEAREAAEWLLSMQAPDGGFYFRKRPDGSIEREEYVWDSFWVAFGLYTYLQMRMPEELGSLISLMTSEVQTAEFSGVDTTLCRYYLSMAQECLNLGKYLKALDYIQMANNTLASSRKTLETINEVESMISQAKMSGANVTEAENKLSQALEHYRSGDYEKGLELALEAEKIANLSLMEIKSEANRILNETRSLIDERAATGMNVTEAEILLEEAFRLFSQGNYSGAIEVAKMAQESAMAVSSAGEGNKMIVTIGGIIGVAALSTLGVLVFRRREARKRELEMREFMEKFEELLDKYVVLTEWEEAEEEV